MNAELHHPVTEADGPADPTVAGAAMGRAVRVADAASGMAILVTAAVIGLAGALMYGLGEREAPYYVSAWIAIFVGIGPVYWGLFFALKRARRGAGLPSVEPRRPSVARVALLGLAVALYLAIFGASVILLRPRASYWLFLIVPFGALFGGLWLVRGCLAREWEDGVVGLAIVAISVLPLAYRASAPEVWVVLAAAAFAVSGAAKHIRWRRWVRGLQRGRDGTTGQEVPS